MVFNWLKKKLSSKPEENRVTRAWDQLSEEAGLKPVFSIDDVEARRLEIKACLAEILKTGAITQENMTKIVDQVFSLFMVAASPWYRGLDDEDLASKVADFLDNYRDTRRLESFVPYLFEEAVFLVNLSWKENDVTVTPPYIVSTTPILSPAKTAPSSQIDTTGLSEMQRDLERMKKEIKEKKA